MAHSLNNIARTRFALGANHRSTLGYAAQGLAQVLGTADKRYVKLCLVDMVNVIGRTEHLTLVDIVNLYGLQYLCLGNVADAALCHHGYAHGLLNTANHFRVAHSRYTTCCTYIGRNSLKCHHGACSCLFGYACLFRGCNVHNNSALKHLGQLTIQCLSFVHLLCVY